MAEFGTGKTVFILAIVVGCFAILWPKIFYPMLITSLSGTSPHSTVPPVMDTTEVMGPNLCCDVIFETDVTAIKVLTDMCGHILYAEDEGPQLHVGHLPKAVIERCRAEVLSACGLDIASVIRDNVRLTKNYKQILDEIRTFNNSACLKRNFGLQLNLLGTPRQMRLFREKTSRHLRPERPPHLHPEMLHPALRDKGRAIPQQKDQKTPPKQMALGAITGLDGSPPKLPGHPIPGMRPTLGGAGHVVPAPKGSGTMGIVMPLYTVGIVIFFVYTIMKVLFKKTTEDPSKYSEFGIDPDHLELRRRMFGVAAMEECAAAAQQAAIREEKRRASPEASAAHINGYSAPMSSDQRPSSKLGDVEMDQLRKRLEETEAAMERIVAQMGSAVDPHPRSTITAASLLKTVPRQEGERENEMEKIEKIIEDTIKETVEKQVEQAQALTADEEIQQVILETQQEEVEEVHQQEDEKDEDFKDEEIPDMALEEDQDLKEDEPLETGPDDTKEEEEEQIQLDVNHQQVTNDHTTLPERTTTPVQQLLEEGSGQVTVLGMETTAQCEGGQKWSGRPPTPDTPPRCTTPIVPLYAIEQYAPLPPPPPPPHYRWARPPTPPTPPRSATPLSHFTAAPHSYLLETTGVVQGGQHGILVADSECEALPVPHGDPDTEEDEDSPPVILSGKMTLSVISLPDTPAPPSATEPQQQQPSTPASPALPRRAMQVSPPQIEEHAADEQGALDRVKPAESEVVVVNGDDALHKHGEPLSNGGMQQDEITATNYTTASAAAAEGGQGGERQEETSADISGIDEEHAEAADTDEPAAELEELPQDDDDEPLPPHGMHGQSNGML